MELGLKLPSIDTAIPCIMSTTRRLYLRILEPRYARKSILESMANLLKRKFHAKHCTTEKVALARFTEICEEMDQKTIQRIYNKYTKRLHDCRHAKGQMTKY